MQPIDVPPKYALVLQIGIDVSRLIRFVGEGIDRTVDDISEGSASVLVRHAVEQMEDFHVTEIEIVDPDGCALEKRIPTGCVCRDALAPIASQDNRAYVVAQGDVTSIVVATGREQAIRSHRSMLTSLVAANRLFFPCGIPEQQDVELIKNTKFSTTSVDLAARGVRVMFSGTQLIYIG